MSTSPIGVQLRARREALGLSLRDVAVVALDLSWQGIARIESGERQPSAASLVSLARGLGVTFTIDPDGISMVIPLADVLAA